MKFVKILAALTGFVVGITAVSAQAQVTVTKEGTARSTGSISNVTDDDIIDWVIQIENIGAADLSNVSITDILQGNHSIIPGSFASPSAIDVDQSAITTSSTTFSASSALIADSSSRLVEPLAKEISSSSVQLPAGSGDGYKVVFHPSTERIFFSSHHWTTLTTNCISLLTEEACEGYPKTFTTAGGLDVSTPTVFDGYEILGDHYYFLGRPIGTDNYGVGCWDIVTETECGFTQMGLFSDHVSPIIGFAKISNTEWWAFDNFQRGHCFNPLANALCTGTSTIDFSSKAGGPPVNLAPSVSIYDTDFDFDVLGTKVYGTVRYRSGLYNDDALEGYYATCYDLASGGDLFGVGSRTAFYQSQHFHALFTRLL